MSHLTVAIEGRLALVTGGGRGIGRAVARALKGRGARVAILGRSTDALERAVDSGDADHAFAVDVTDHTAVASCLKDVEALGDIGILVTNVGAARTASHGRTDAVLMREMFEVNVLSATVFVAALAPAMVARGHGRIVAVASMAGLKGYAYTSAYVASKHALVGYVRAVAVELAKSGVTINAVCPGFTDTDLLDRSVEMIMGRTGRSRDDAIAELVRHNPQGRLVAPDEVAAAVAWLCGPGSASINGQAIEIAGGET